MKMECDNLYGWIKKTATYAKISSKMMNPRDVAGNTEEEDLYEKNTDLDDTCLSVHSWDYLSVLFGKSLEVGHCS